MAKIYGLFGSMTGKLADVVMAVRNGEQVARKYQPVVFNPATPAQVAQRAKMKLLSQLSAVLAPAIAIRRQGSVSARNIFTKVNFPLTSFASDEASINLPAVTLTNSVVALPTLGTTPAVDGTISVSLSSQDEINVDRVVYILVTKEGDNKLRMVSSVVVTEEGIGTFRFAHTFEGATGENYVYAYGIRVNSEAARVVFSNLTSPTAEDIAKIVTTSTLTENDITLTETRGASATIPTSRDSDDDERKSRKK